MSEMTAIRLAKASTLVLLAAGWAVAAWLLWQTSVPDSLHLPRVSAREEFGADVLRRAARFDGFLRWEWVAATCVELAAIVGLPFGFLSLWWSRRYHLEKQGYGSWLLEQWPSLLAQVVGLTIMLTILLLLAGGLRRGRGVLAPALLV